MSRSDLPAAPAHRPNALCGDVPLSALERYTPIALADTDRHTLNIIGQIGDWWDDNTAESVVRFLTAADGADITVNIHSPGGDMFEGIAIYNLLRLYSGKVTVNVLGEAASAASLIAMAGNEVLMPPSAFLMIHNCWFRMRGNRHDFAAAAEQMQPFDDAMCGIYAARTGISRAEITVMMDNETYINGDKAVELGFADRAPESAPTLLPAPEPAAAAHRIDVLLAKQAVPRSERRKLLAAIKGTHNAASAATPRADGGLLAEIQRLHQDMQT